MKKTLIGSAGLVVVMACAYLAWGREIPVLGSVTGCQAYSGIPANWKNEPLAGMVRITGGRFTPGTEGGYSDERPFTPVIVGDFWIDRTEVTRAQFASFVEATGYVTEAERSGGGAVFKAPLESAADGSALPWWHFVKGANWRLPDGPEGAPAKLDAMPVTQVTLADARAYAEWRGNELPTEAEWEYAARAGEPSQRLGEEPVDSEGKPTANYWQGVFPVQDDGEDGFKGVAPTGCFKANGYGLFDMIGNVWEWTADSQQGPIFSHANGDPGLTRGTLFRSRFQVIKGGSWLCAASYCARYRTSARERQEVDMPTSHVGFRTIHRVADGKRS